MSWKVRAVAVATGVVAVAAVVGFGVELPSVVSAADARAEAAVAAASDAAGAGASAVPVALAAGVSVDGHGALAASERWASAVALSAPAYDLLIASDGAIDPSARAVLEQALTGLGRSSAESTARLESERFALTVSEPSIALDPQQRSAAAASALYSAMEGMRTVVVAWGRSALDSETPDADASLHDALAASLASPAVAAVGPGTPAALSDLLAKTRAARDAQTAAAHAAAAAEAAAAAAAAEAADSSGGSGDDSGGSGDDDHLVYGPFPPIHLDLTPPPMPDPSTVPGPTPPYYDSNGVPYPY